MRLDRDPSRAQVARRIGRAWLEHACRIPKDRVDPAVLMLSELVTNAIVHGGADEVGVHAWVSADGYAWIAVDDYTPSPVPKPITASAAAENGRGLQLVETFAVELGGQYGHSADGTVAWCCIPLQQPTAEAARGRGSAT
jgi:anti-sigma regulatory factor (Ser/Thr protein kinase)